MTIMYASTSQTMTLPGQSPARLSEYITRIVSGDLADTTTYTGITTVARLFSMQYTPEYHMLHALTGEAPTSRQNDEWARMIRNWDNASSSTQAQIVLQMDWLQQFVLRWVNVEVIDAVCLRAGIPANTEGNDTTPPAHAVLPPEHLLLDNWLGVIDTLCSIANEMWRERDKLNNVQYRLGAQNEQLDTARTFIKDQTMEHSGCDNGKREFLTGTGLWDEDDVDEMFSTECDVYINVTLQVCVTREIPGPVDEREDWVNDNIDTTDVEDAVRDFLQSDSVDWEVSSVSEA